LPQGEKMIDLYWKNWKQGTIWYPSRTSKSPHRLKVRYMPESGKKIAIRENNSSPTTNNQDFYWWNSTKKTWCKVEHGIFELYASFTHILTNYQANELPKLAEIEKLADDLQIEFVELGSANVILRSGKRARLTITQILNHFGRVLEYEKRQAKAKYVLLVTLKDSRGRVNVGAFMCRNISAVARILSRNENIQQISLRIQYYQQLVLAYIQKLEQMRTQAWDSLVRAYNRTKRSGIGPGTITNKQIKIAIQQAKKRLDQMDFKPYTRSKKNTLRDLVIALGYLQDGDKPKLLRALSKSLNAMDILALRMPIQLAKMHVSDANRHRKSSKLTFTPELKYKIVVRLRKILNVELPKIDDSNFRTRVVEKIEAYVKVALITLDSKDPNYKLVYIALDEALGWI
jgi:hypothetical protein